MRIVVLGAGAVGSYYGGLLARAGDDVVCFARGATLAALRERGLEVKTPDGGFQARVTATDRVEGLAPADVAILAVKSYALEGIAPVVRRCAEQGTAVLPLMNGVETAERLAHLGVPSSALIGGLTTISVVRLGPGVVERVGPLQVVVAGEFDGCITERVTRIVAAFREAGVDARASDHIQVELWQKFDFIAALAAACGLARVPVGPLRTDRLGRRLLERAIGEVVAVARARGVAIPDDEARRVLTVVDGLPAGMKPSFLVDLEAGRPTELDILSGTVVRFAEEAGIASPIHDTAAFALGARPSRERA